MIKQRYIDVADKIEAFSGTQNIASAIIEYACGDEYDSLKRYSIGKTGLDTLNLDHSSLSLTFNDGAGLLISCSEWAEITFLNAAD